MENNKMATSKEKADVLLAIANWSRRDLMLLLEVLQIILSDEKVE